MRWNITEGDCEEALDCTRHLMRTGGERGRASGLKSMIQMMGQNQKDEHHAKGDTLHVEAAMDLKSVAEKINQGVIENERRAACESDTDSGAVRQIGLVSDERAVANGRPHGDSGPGANGHSNGQA